MIQSKGRHVSLDLQCLSYLLDVVAGVDKPTDPLADEKIALLRSWFYKPGTFFLTQTAITEAARIRVVNRHDLYEAFIRTQFLDHPVRDIAFVQARAEELTNYHPDPIDCRILAEAEDLKLDLLLTFDQDFLKRLGNVSEVTKLIKPTSYWTGLGISKGAKPVSLPGNTNPLRMETWWYY